MNFVRNKESAYQISSLNLITGVTFLSLTIVALVNYSEFWDTIYFSLTLFTIWIATIVIVATRDVILRKFWSAFVVGAVGYLVFAHVPDHENFSPRRFSTEFTTQALKFLSDIALGKIDWFVANDDTDPFRDIGLGRHFFRIGHCFWAIVIGWCGGRFAMYICACDPPNCEHSSPPQHQEIQ